MILTLLLYFVLSVLLGAGIYYGWKLMKVAAAVSSELLVMYKLFTGGSSHSGTKRPLRLYAYSCETHCLDKVAINELYNFLFGSKLIVSEINGGKEKTMAFLHQALLKYSDIVLLRDKIDGTLRGMSTIGINHMEDRTVIKIGPTFFTNYYKGGPYTYLITGYFVLKELFFRPFTPLYIVGKAIGYHAYMFATKFKECYPRYDKETPEYFKKIIDEFAISELHEGDTYDEETNVVKQEQTHLPENLLAVSEKDLQNPHIKFFVERNPEYTKGHFLVCGWKVDWSALATLFVQSFMKFFRRSKLREGGAGRTREKKSRPQLLRRITFQEESANDYAVNMFQMSFGGEAIISRTNEHGFAFRSLSPASSPMSPMTPMSRLPHIGLT